MTDNHARWAGAGRVKRIVLAATVVAAVLITVAYGLVRHELTGRIAKCLHAQGIAISLGGPLGLAHLVVTGSARNVRLTAASARVEHLTLRSINATARDVHVSPWVLVTGHATASAGSVTAQASITQADLDSALHFRGLPLQVRIDRSAITVEAEAGGITLVSLQAGLKTARDGRDLTIQLIPSLMPNLVGLNLPALVAIASLPPGVSLDRLVLRPGAVSVAIHSSRPVRLSLSTCPA